MTLNMSKGQKITLIVIIILLIIIVFIGGAGYYKIKKIENRISTDSTMFSEEISNYDTTIVELDRKLKRSQIITMKKIKSDSQSFRTSIDSLGKQIKKTTKQSQNNNKRLNKLEKKVATLEEQAANNTADSIKARETVLLLLLNSRIEETSKQLTTRMDSVTREVVIARQDSSKTEETNKKIHWRKRR
jgi:chromosome segregation ATPase